MTDGTGGRQKDVEIRVKTAVRPDYREYCPEGLAELRQARTDGDMWWDVPPRQPPPTINQRLMGKVVDGRSVAWV